MDLLNRPVEGGLDLLDLLELVGESRSPCHKEGHALATLAHDARLWLTTRPPRRCKATASYIGTLGMNVSCSDPTTEMPVSFAMNNSRYCLFLP